MKASLTNTIRPAGRRGRRVTALMLATACTLLGLAPASAGTSPTGSWFTLRPGAEMVNVLEDGTTAHSAFCTGWQRSCPDPRISRATRSADIDVSPVFGGTEYAMVRARDNSGLITIPAGARGLRIAGYYPVHLDDARCRRLAVLGSSRLHFAATTMLLDERNHILFIERTASANLCDGTSPLDDATLDLGVGIKAGNKRTVSAGLTIKDIKLLTTKTLTKDYRMPMSLVTDEASRVAPIRGLTPGNRVRLYSTVLVYTSAANGPSQVRAPLVFLHPKVTLTWLPSGN